MPAGAYNQATAEVRATGHHRRVADVAVTALGISHGPTVPRVESRAAGDYTDQLLAGAFAAATGRLQASATAGVQAAAGIVGRALASATVEGDGGAVDPHLLEGIGTDLYAPAGSRRLTVGPGARLRVLRAGAVASVVYGDADPDTWRYSLSMGGPSSARTVWATAAEVVNVPHQQRLLSDRGKASHRSPGRSPERPARRAAGE